MASSWTTDWHVSVDGTPMTTAMRPYLTSIRVSDQAGSASDSCALVFDDSGGQLRLPRSGSSISVRLDGVQVFSGVTDSVRSSGSRSAGRTLNVSAKGFDVRGNAKTPQLLHLDDGTIGDFLQKLGEKAGFTTRIDPALAAIARDYLVADGESFLHMGEKLARELGGTFKLRGDEAVLAKRGGDLGLPTIEGLFTADSSGNMLSWDIEPLSARPVFKEIAVRYFDRAAGEIKTRQTEAPAGQAVEAVNLVRSVAHDDAQAGDVGAGRAREIEREGGTGRVSLLLTPEAQAEALFTVSGTRPGVDGTYRITSVTHSADRAGGARTDLELKQPSDGAGTDSRRGGATDPASAAQSGVGQTPGTAGQGAASGSGGDLQGDRPGDGPE